MVKASSRRFSALWILVVMLTPLALLALSPLPPASGFEKAGQYSGVVIGQKDFVSSVAGTAPNQFESPFGIAVDPAGDLWVTEETNNRILEFRPPFTDGMDASVVIGQVNFTTHVRTATRSGLSRPSDVTFDPAGDLWVADLGNDRVLEFEPPFSNGMNASLELGQPAGRQEFTSSINPYLPNGLDVPTSVLFDHSGDLWVSDRLNDRVLEFRPPFADGMNASAVIGQSGIGSFSDNLYATPSTLWGPEGIALDSKGNLWVADEEHNRVLEFAASSLGTNDPNATLEIGQPAGRYQFTNNTATDTASGFVGPFGLAFDSSGNLWVSDHRDNRVLEFQQPLADGEVASLEIGQPGGVTEFTSSVPATNQTTLDNPLGIAFDQSGDLFVADQLNNRVLGFDSMALKTDGTTASVLDLEEGLGANNSQVTGNCSQVGDQDLCHLVSDQTATTGIEADVTGVAPGSAADVYSVSYGNREPTYYGRSIPLQAASSFLFYGVSVSGVGNGTATVCVDLQQGQPASDTEMLESSYGGAWTVPPGVSGSGSAICGPIPLSSPGAETLIAVGGNAAGPGASPESASAFQAAVPVAALGAALAVALAVIAVRKRRGRPLEDVEGEDYDDLEGWG